MVKVCNSSKIMHNEERFKEEKKEGFRSVLNAAEVSTTVRLPTLFIKTTTFCLPLKALLFFTSFNIDVISSCTSRTKMCRLGLTEIS
jgi:hypothetical protein